MLYHITSKTAWEQAQKVGTYRADSLETEGFIHCSRLTQVLWVADAFYRGQTGLVLLCIDPERVSTEIRYETVEGVPIENDFPHLYGALNLDAVVRMVNFEPDAQGRFHLPSGIKPD